LPPAAIEGAIQATSPFACAVTPRVPPAKDNFWSPVVFNIRQLGGNDHLEFT
jgi:hypothetical protein